MPSDGGGDAWRHGAIELRPLNPAFEALRFSADDEVVIVAEMVAVL